MSILITGHCGFVGRNLTEALDKRSIPWVGYDLVEGNDIRDRHALECFFETNQVTHVVHLAARAGLRRGNKYTDEYITTNVCGTQNIVDMCNLFKIKKLIFYSSSSVYGEVSELPVKETNIKKPICLYGITKLAAEHIVRNSTCPNTTLIPFTIYGKYGRKDEVIYKWLEQHKNGLPLTVYNLESFRGYVNVADIVETTIKLLRVQWEWQSEIFNIGGSEVIYLKDIFNEFKEYFPHLMFEMLPMPKEEIIGQYADTTKAKKALGFDPQPKFIENLRKIIREE